MTRTKQSINRKAWLLLSACLAAAPIPAVAQDVMRGHGGPVRALSVRGEARELISGSFDSTVIVWDLQRGTAKRVLRFHEGPINAVTALPNGCFASGGEDKRVAIWCGEMEKPAWVLKDHEAPVTSLAGVFISPAAAALGAFGVASGSFDGTVQLSVLGTGGRQMPIAGHKGPVTAVAATPDQQGVISAGPDGALVLTTMNGVGNWGPLAGRSTATALGVAPDGEILAAGSDGFVRGHTSHGLVSAEIEIDTIPLASLAVTPDGKLIATAGLRGGIAIIDRASRKIIHRLTGPGLPVWSLAFDTDNRTLFSGGADRVIRRWDAVAGTALTSNLPERDPVAEAAASGERGAVVFRACQACHTLLPDGGNRAGPTLHGVFGRRIGSVPGYAYSQALPRMPIVWSRETIAKLFEVGPNAYTPGTKMPEQTITDPADRQALVEWLERMTVTR